MLENWAYRATSSFFKSSKLSNNGAGFSTSGFCPVLGFLSVLLCPYKQSRDLIFRSWAAARLMGGVSPTLPPAIGITFTVKKRKESQTRRNFILRLTGTNSEDPGFGDDGFGNACMWPFLKSNMCQASTQVSASSQQPCEAGAVSDPLHGQTDKDTGSHTQVRS